jgi:DNA ligase-1
VLNVSIMEQVAATTKPTEKVKLLKEMPELGRRLLRLACDPLVTFGVTVDEDAVAALSLSPMSEPIEVWWQRFEAVLNDLKARAVTGNAADDLVVVTFSLAPSELHARWAARILNRDLRAGIKAATLDKAWPDSKEQRFALADKYDKKKKPTLKGRWYFEPKLDGLRLVVIGGVAYSRGGREIKTVGHILKELHQVAGIEGYVLDGEVMGSGTFEETVSAAKNVAASGGACVDLVYNVFDCVRIDEWKSRETRKLSERKADLVALLPKDMPHVKVVPWVDRSNADFPTIKKHHDEFRAKGYEGIMLKLDAPYEFKRSKVLLKLKEFEDIDLKVVGSTEGLGKYQGMLGNLIVSEDGIRSEVGSGFSDEQRRLFWEKRESLVGRTVEVRFQEKTAEGKLRFPTFVRFRDDKDSL